MPKPTSGPHDHPEYATDSRVDGVERLASDAATKATKANTTAQTALNAATSAQASADNALNEIAQLTARVNDYHPTDPTPPDPPDPPDPPPDDPLDDWAMLVDPDQIIRPEWSPYWERALAALNNPNHYQNHWQTDETINGHPKVEDLYWLWRVWGHNLFLAVIGLRATARPEFLDVIQRMLDHIKPGLRNHGTWEGFTYWHSANYEHYGTPWHYMETMGVWGVISMGATACRLNGDDDRCDYWFGNLAQQEAGWANDPNRPGNIAPFPRHSLTHPNIFGLAMYSHYTGRLGEAADLVDRFRAGLRSNPEGIKGWHHYLDGPTSSFPTFQIGRYYPSYSASGAMNMRFEGYDIGMDFNNLARAFNRDVFPDENHSDGAWSISNYALAAAWDATGELGDHAEVVNVAMGDDKDVPRRAHISVALLVELARRFPPDRRPA